MIRSFLSLKLESTQISCIDRLTEFNFMSTSVGGLYIKTLENCVNWTFIFVDIMKMFLKNFSFFFCADQSNGNNILTVLFDPYVGLRVRMNLEEPLVKQTKISKSNEMSGGICRRDWVFASPGVFSTVYDTHIQVRWNIYSAISWP